MKSFEFLSEATSLDNIYTVKSGDSLPSIAQANDTTVDGIMWQNPQFASPNDIVPGLQIRLPGSSMKSTPPGASTGRVAPGPGGSAGNAKIAMDYFTQKGWSLEQAAGIVANLQAESGQNLNPSALGDNGQAYGIGQWAGPRQRLFATKMGKSLQGSNLQDQLDFVQWELTNSEAKAGRALKGAQTAADAAAIVDQYYERSNGQARQKRMAMATALAPSTSTA